MVGTVADMAGMAHTASTVADMVDTVADMVDMVAGLDIVDNPDFMGTTDSVNMEDMEEGKFGGASPGAQIGAHIGGLLDSLGKK
uniref:Uncharacterized protein n=1 Tax=Parascaris univalens TaxID=6257 RepID=A0A914ZRQ6_PARUN